MIKERIAEIIEDQDINITLLAEKLNVNRRQVHRWQNGEAEMGIYKLREFCLITGVSADYILEWPKNMNFPR